MAVHRHLGYTYLAGMTLGTVGAVALAVLQGRKIFAVVR